CTPPARACTRCARPASTTPRRWRCATFWCRRPGGMTTPSDPKPTPSEAAAAMAVAGERRLHPLSWLFVAIQQLKQFALPLLVLLVTGRGNTWELWGMVGAGGLVLYSLLLYFTYRFR